MDPLSFAAATALVSISSHEYAGTFLDDWCIGTVPHGGYVTSCFLAAVQLHFSTTLAAQNQPHPFTLHIEFLRRTEVGPYRFAIKELKLGRGASTVSVTLSQTFDGHERIEAIATIGVTNLTTAQGDTLETHWKLNPPPASADLAKFGTDSDTNWTLMDDTPAKRFRKAHVRSRTYLPRQGSAFGTYDEWLGLKNGEMLPDAAIGYVSDLFMLLPELFRAHHELGTPWSQMTSTGKTRDKPAISFWYPTVSMTLDIKKALPPGGTEFLFQRVMVKQLKNGRHDYETVILDSEGDLVAISHHVVMIVDVARNTAKRSRKTEKL